MARTRGIGLVVLPALLLGGLAGFVRTSDDAAAQAEQVFAGSAASAESVARSTEKVPTGYKLVWRDEFTGTKLSDRWTSAPALTGLRPCTRTSPSTAVVRDGTVRISALLDKSKPKSAECPKGWFVNAQFTTENSKRFTHGYFAARIKVQHESGMHGGWWVYNDPEPAPGVPRTRPHALGAEMDALEYFGDRDVKGKIKAGVQNSLYFYTVNPDGSLKLNKRGGRQDVRKIIGKTKTPSDGYHVYSVEWTPKAVVFRLDGKETFRFTGTLSTRSHYLILSMLTSPFETDQLRVNELPGTMLVDWVRVYQKK